MTIHSMIDFISPVRDVNTILLKDDISAGVSIWISCTLSVAFY